MRPQRLEIEGVHSFLNRQTVDFSALSADGLFGIFGDTGSGKSTVLDCIILALYGEIPGETAEEFIHLKANSAFVALEFALGGKRFRVERSFRFNGRRDLVTSNAKLVDLGDSAILCEQTKRVSERLVELLGLSRRDFCKVVALPQGEFSEFLKSTSADQTDIAGRLFSLEMYGSRLMSNANGRLKECKRDLEELETRLSEYAGVTEEALSACGEGLEADRAREAELQQRAQAAVRSLEGLRRDFDCTQKLALARQTLALREKERAEAEESRRLAARKKLSEERVAPALARRDEAKKSLEAAVLALAETTPARERVEIDSLRAAKALADFEEAFGRQKRELEAREIALRGLQGRREAFETLSGQLADSRKEYRAETEKQRAAETARETVATEFETVQRNLSACEADRDRLTESLSGIVNEAFLQKLKSAFSHDLREAEIQYKGSERCFSETAAVIAGARSDDSLLRTYTELSERLRELVSRRAELEADCRNRTEELVRIRAEQEKLLAAGQEAHRAHGEILSALGALGLADFAALDGALEQGKRTAEAGENTLRNLRAAERLAQNDLSRLREAESGCLARRTSAEEALNREQSELAARLAEVPSGEDGASFSEKEALAVHALELSAGEVLARAEALDRELADLRVKIGTLEESRAGDVTEAQVAAAEAESNRLKREAAEAQKACVLGANRLEELGKRLGSKRDLEVRLREKRRRCDVVESIARAVKGKALMQFAVEEYLREICVSASSILAGITNGSYRLVYERRDRDVGFFVADNRNGGEKRSVATLSGGETFLVSLALAVSLSEAVALRGTSRVEFFFLDEGFGSLDGRLCDVVLDALYALKEDRFVIGLISHVEGLKERIESRLFVQFDEESGSRFAV